MSFECMEYNVVEKEVDGKPIPGQMVVHMRLRWDTESGHKYTHKCDRDENTAAEYINNCLKKWLWNKLKRTIDDCSSDAWKQEWNKKDWAQWDLMTLCIMATHNVEDLLLLIKHKEFRDYTDHFSAIEDVVNTARWWMKANGREYPLTRFVKGAGIL